MAVDRWPEKYQDCCWPCIRMMADQFLPKRSPDKYQRLVAIRGIYHVQYCVTNSLQSLPDYARETSFSQNVALMYIKGLSQPAAFIMPKQPSLTVRCCEWDELLPKRSPDKYQRLVTTSSIYRVQYCVINSLQSLPHYARETSFSWNVAPINIKGLSQPAAFIICNKCIVRIVSKHSHLSYTASARKRNWNRQWPMTWWHNQQCDWLHENQSYDK